MTTMTANKRLISNEQAIPLLATTDIFKDYPDARFALGVVSRSTLPSEGMQDLFTAYLKLRANVYVDQTEMLGQEAKRDDGTEIDGDDKRSTHFVAVENRLSHIAVISSMRVIEKSEENGDPLPIEHFFAMDGSVPVGGNEISRYIHRLKERGAAAEIRSGLFMAALAHINNNELGPTLAVVESELEDSLLHAQVPLVRIAEPQWVEQYNSMNIGISIDTAAFAEQFGGPDVMGMIKTEPGDFTYWGKVNNK